MRTVFVLTTMTMITCILASSNTTTLEVGLNLVEKENANKMGEDHGDDYNADYGYPPVYPLVYPRSIINYLIKQNFLRITERMRHEALALRLNFPVVPPWHF